MKGNNTGSWVDISAGSLTRNLESLQAAAGPQTGILAVVKANAYGHGLELCAPVLAAAGARWLGVTGAAEGVRVRQALASAAAPSSAAALAAPPHILLMCGFLPQDLGAITDHALTPVLWTAEQADWLASAGGSRNTVHIEVDTAMGRQGVMPGIELDRLLHTLRNREIAIGGIMTHFSSSEYAPGSAGAELTQLQQRRFERALAQVAALGLKPDWVHAGNTSSIDNPADPHSWLRRLATSVGARPMVRSGLGLFGYCLPIEGPADDAVPHHVRSQLERVMTWKAPVLSVRELHAEDTIGYNATYVAPNPLRVALLSVGYADGLRRELSSSNLPGSERAGGWVLFNGHRAPILGRISMNLIVVDVSAIEGVRPGDTAILLGDGISADDHARLAGTIAYEILCGVKAGAMQLAP